MKSMGYPVAERWEPQWNPEGVSIANGVESEKFNEILKGTLCIMLPNS